MLLLAAARMRTRSQVRAGRAELTVEAPAKARLRPPARPRRPAQEADLPAELAIDRPAVKGSTSRSHSDSQAEHRSNNKQSDQTAHEPSSMLMQPGSRYVNNIVAKPAPTHALDDTVVDSIPAFHAARTQPAPVERTAAKSHTLGQSATALLAYLATGTTLTLLSSHIGNQDLADSSVQVLALAKFSAMLAFTSGLQLLSRQPAYKATKRTTMLMSGLGMLDVVGYATYCLGLELCGAALCTLINAAAQQLFTAILSRVLLGRRFTRLQQTSLFLVVGGLVARSLAGGSLHIPGVSADSVVPLSQQYELQGAVLTLMSALTYSCLNLLYDYTVQSTEDPPPHPVIMNQMARVGLLANGLYTAAFTLPHWDTLVGRHLEQSQHGAWGAAGLLAVFGVLYNLHGIVQGRAFRLEGALGIALVNSMKGSSVAIVCSMLYCSATSPGSCLNPGSSLSAIMITLGGILWVIHGASPKGALARELKRLESKNIV